MSTIKRYTLDEIEKIAGRSDRKKIDATSEKDILEQSLADPDTPILTHKERRELRPASERKHGR